MRPRATAYTARISHLVLASPLLKWTMVCYLLCSRTAMKRRSLSFGITTRMRLARCFVQHPYRRHVSRMDMTATKPISSLCFTHSSGFSKKQQHTTFRSRTVKYTPTLTIGTPLPPFVTSWPLSMGQKSSDRLLTEVYKQGIAGDDCVWPFFPRTITDREHEPNSPLAVAGREGSTLIVHRGLAGTASFDNFC